MQLTCILFHIITHRFLRRVLLIPWGMYLAPSHHPVIPKYQSYCLRGCVCWVNLDVLIILYCEILNIKYEKLNFVCAIQIYFMFSALCTVYCAWLIMCCV